ncbi:MAG: hypothetical protein WKF84_00855 [Pyrinomonadaceae bacterium]
MGTLALAIGTNAAIFSVVNGVILKPLPYHEPERLMMVWQDERAKATAKGLLPMQTLKIGARRTRFLRAWPRRPEKLSGKRWQCTRSFRAVCGGCFCGFLSGDGRRTVSRQKFFSLRMKNSGGKM